MWKDQSRSTSATATRNDYGPGPLALDILRMGFLNAGDHAVYEAPPNAHNFWWRFTHLVLPYGFYSEADGAVVIFNRRYAPLWRIKSSGERELAHGWIDHVRQMWFFSDANPPWRNKTMIAMSKKLFDKNGICDGAVPIYEALIAEITRRFRYTDESRSEPAVR
jgi:hypothetical protein